jgi:DNA-binding SARP family transcriptional activator
LVTRDEIQFNQSSQYQVDVEAFSERIESYENHAHEDLTTCTACKDQLLGAVDLYRGDFLADFYLPHSPDFNDWAILKREFFQRQVSDALSKLAQICEARGEVGLAAEYSRQLVDLEPWNEENHRNLMHLLALNGMRGAALRQYQICCESLERELGVEPSNATVALYEKISAWEAGTFPNSQEPPIPVDEPEKVNNPTEVATSNPQLIRKLSRRSVLALIIAGLILGIGAVHWLGAQYRLWAASSSGNQAIPQMQTSRTTQANAPSPTTAETEEIGIASETIPQPTETSVLEAVSAQTSFSSASTDTEKQLQALIAIYEQTDGPNWGNNEGWLSDRPICEWYGVTCWGEKLIELELANNHLDGNIPAEIGQLADLENLDLGHNQLRGPIPPEIGNLSSLQRLTLWGNRELSGPIPPELGNLSNLEYLELAHWDSGGSLLSGEIPPELGKLKKLRYLSISVSLLHGPLPVELCSLTILEDLYLDSNRLNGSIPPEIGNMVSLGALDLGGNDFDGPIPPELGNLSMLTYLALGGCLVAGEVPAELGNLLRLRNLVLDNTGLSGRLPNTLMNLNLRELTFFGTDVCEPADEAFQAWLNEINDLQSSEIVCESQGD